MKNKHRNRGLILKWFIILFSIWGSMYALTKWIELIRYIEVIGL